ncbi:MAG: class I mannose-6-phosphate isomerase [Pirellulales bacterium]|nr:class I mannose-6-phosphate isomerase [Pirellulales bacterium]
MKRLYPLRFRPILRRYIWGGRRLETLLHKSLGPGNDYAESWEICDHGQHQSIVESGPLAGTTLGQLVSERGEALLGQHHSRDRFPLLLKFLDANRTLSVQVHPDDARAARLTPPDLGKTEAWVVLAAESGGTIYAGLRSGVDRDVLARAIREGNCEQCLHQFHPLAGDCVLLPAGTVHALGEGLLVAEIQQASDVTYRLFDWNRLDDDGNPRPLHVEQGLEAIDYDRGPVAVQRPRATDRASTSRLVECDKFVLDRLRLDVPEAVGGDLRCHIITVLEGSLRIEGDPANRALSLGQTALLPASIGSVRLTPQGQAVLLDAYLPHAR